MKNKKKSSTIIIFISAFIALYLTCITNEVTLTTNLQRIFIYTYFWVLLSVGLIVYRRKLETSSRNILNKKLIAVFAIISLFLCVVFNAFLCPKIYLPNKISISILNNTNINSQGHEVWITGVRLDGASEGISQYSYLGVDSGWNDNGNALVGNGPTSKTLELNIRKAKEIELSFVKHQWSGIIEIKNGCFEEVCDLYDANGDNLVIKIPTNFMEYKGVLHFAIMGGCFLFLLTFFHIIYYILYKQKEKVM